MKLFRNNYKLTEIFKSAAVPDIAEFNGEYLVDMLTGPPSLSGFGHRKVFYTDGDEVLGYNVIKKPWGYFSLEAGVSDVDGQGVVVINYDTKENPFILRGIRDHVRCIEEKTVYIGRFNYTFQALGKLVASVPQALGSSRTRGSEQKNSVMDNLHFMGYFLLLRVP